MNIGVDWQITFWICVSLLLISVSIKQAKSERKKREQYLSQKRKFD